jgi:hypothetical protein
MATKSITDCAFDAAGTTKMIVPQPMREMAAKSRPKS